MKKLSTLPRFPQIITVDNYFEKTNSISIVYTCTYSDESEDQDQQLTASKSDLESAFNRIGWDANTVYSLEGRQVVKVNRRQSFSDYWNNATKSEKLRFIAFYMDGYKSQIVAKITANLLKGRSTSLASLLK